MTVYSPSLHLTPCVFSTTYSHAGVCVKRCKYTVYFHEMRYTPYTLCVCNDLESFPPPPCVTQKPRLQVTTRHAPRNRRMVSPGPLATAEAVIPEGPAEAITAAPA